MAAAVAKAAPMLMKAAPAITSAASGAASSLGKAASAGAKAGAGGSYAGANGVDAHTGRTAGQDAAHQFNVALSKARWEAFKKIVGRFINAIIYVIWAIFIIALPYLVVLFFIWALWRISHGQSVFPRRSGGRTVAPIRQRSSWSIWRFLPGPGWKQAIQRINVFGAQPKTTARPKIEGRCNGMDFAQSGGSCVRTTIPHAVEWTIDTNAMPDFYHLPQGLQDQLTNHGARTNVRIPWELDDTFYLPRCDWATFDDGSSAAYLFKDTGLGCRRPEARVPIFTESYRPKPGSPDFNGLGGLASPEDPKCTPYEGPTPPPPAVPREPVGPIRFSKYSTSLAMPL